MENAKHTFAQLKVSGEWTKKKKKTLTDSMKFRLELFESICEMFDRMVHASVNNSVGRLYRCEACVYAIFIVRFVP